MSTDTLSPSPSSNVTCGGVGEEEVCNNMDSTKSPVRIKQNFPNICRHNPSIRVSCDVLRRTNTTDMGEKIVVPKRIPREPTDILKALASTIQRDPTAAHYKYHDDPYLIPTSNVGKRTFAMAKESGRKAARWIQTKHAKLFQHRVADPPIKDFIPQVTYSEDSEVDEDSLKDVIEQVSVKDAIMVYGLLCRQGKEITNTTKQSLLELLCFYNCEDTLPEDLIEERWFSQMNKVQDRQRKMWKDNSMAHAIFESMEPKDATAYCAIVQGMAKHYEAAEAWRLYEEAVAKGISLTTTTYNHLIQVVNFLRESALLQWKLIEELLLAMKKQGVQPNVGTLNAILAVVSSMPQQRQAKSFTLQTIAEFKHLGIEPSLASYYYVLLTFCKERGPVSDILVQIMNYIEGKEFVIQDPKDTYFFVTAMDVCRRHLQDKDLASQVDRLLHTGDNYNFLGDSYKESIYYRHYFMLMCTMETLETFMVLYDRLVPHIYIPEPRVMEEVLNAVNLNGAMEQLPRLWTDIVMFRHAEQQNLVQAFVRTMVANQPQDGSELALQFGRIAWDIWQRIEDISKDRYHNFEWTGTMLGDIIVLCLRAGEFDNAAVVLERLGRGLQAVMGLPEVDALLYFLDACIAHKDVARALACITFAAEHGYSEAGRMAQKLQDSMELSHGILSKLEAAVGKEVLRGQDVAS